MSVALEDLRVLDDTDLAEMYGGAGERECAAILAELDRRDRADRLARARERLAVIRNDGEVAVHAQFLAASDWCRGRLLSREGAAAGVSEFALWRLPEVEALRFASPELAEFWEFVSPRLTVAGYVRQRAAEGRAARMEAMDADVAGAAVPAWMDDETEAETEGSMTDGDGGCGETGPGLAGDDGGALRFDPAAAEAPGRAGGAVRPGGRRDGEAAEDGRAGAGARGAAGHVQPARGVSTVAGYTTYADPAMAPITPCHLVPGFLEKGQVVLIAGQGGCGKSMLTAWWAAACTRGELPGCEGRPRSVGWVNAEDDPATSTAWRLRAAGADPARVIDLAESEDGEPFELPRDVGRLRQAIDDNDLALVIIDPLSAVSSLTLTTVLSARKIMMPLQRAARETGCVIAVIHHETKQKGTVAGSKGLVDSVRMVLRVAPDVEVPSDRVLSVSKSNSGGEVTPARFTITGDGTDARVTWLDRDELTRRRTAWRKPADNGPELASVRPIGDRGRTAPGPAVWHSALMGIQRPGQPGPDVEVLGTYPGGMSAQVARRRCEMHPAFRPGAGWLPGHGGNLLSKYVRGDGAVISFGVVAGAS